MGKRIYRNPHGANRQIDQMKTRLNVGQKVLIYEDGIEVGVNPLPATAVNSGVSTHYKAGATYTYRPYRITQFYPNFILLTSEDGIYRRAISYYDMLLWSKPNLEVTA